VSSSVAVGLILAAASTVALNWGFFAQHRAASAGMPVLSLRRPLASLRVLFTNPGWLAGFAVGLTGWALYVAALRVAPLSLVQAVSAGGVGVLALLVSRIADVRLSGREWVGVALSMLGLLLLGVSLAGHTAAGHPAHWTLVLAWIGVSVALALLFAGPGRGALAAGAGFGVAAGLLYAAGDVATKTAVTGGTAALLFVLFGLPVLACHGGAFVTLQLGFQRGGAIATVGVATLFMNALPIAAGMLLYGEQLPGGGLGAARLVAFGFVVLGAALLARGRTAHDPLTPGAQTAWQAKSQGTGFRVLPPALRSPLAGGTGVGHAFQACSGSGSRRRFWWRSF
jgi:hypothetical protein